MREAQSNILKIAAGAAFLWYAVLRGAKGLQVKVHSYSFRGVNLSDNTVSLDLNISIKNPLLVGLTVKGVTGDVYIQGHKAGAVNTVYDYYIAGGKTHVIPVIVNLYMADVLQSALMNIQSGNVQNLTIAFDGKLLVGQYSVGVPLQFELDYNDLVG